EPSRRGLHLNDLECGICRERSPLPGLSKARLPVQRERGQAVSRGPQTESAQPVLPRPVENLLEKGTSDPAPSPCWVYPYTADPSHFALVPLTETVGRTQHILALTSKEHHLTSRRSVRFPVRGRPSRGICERLAKGIRCLLQGSQAELTVKAYLVRLQPSKMHEITRKAVERLC